MASCARRGIRLSAGTVGWLVCLLDRIGLEPAADHQPVGARGEVTLAGEADQEMLRETLEVDRQRCVVVGDEADGGA